MTVKYRNHKTFGNSKKVVTSRTVNGRWLDVEYRHGGSDRISLNAISWFPLARAWPLAWIAIITYCCFLLFCHMAVGHYHTALPPFIIAFGLLSWFPMATLRYSWLAGEGITVQPETNDEAALFATCSVLTLRSLVRQAREKK